MNRINRWWRMLLHPSQAYYWTKDWQAGEAAAQADIDAGRLLNLAELDETDMTRAELHERWQRAEPVNVVLGPRLTSYETGRNLTGTTMTFTAKTPGNYNVTYGPFGSLTAHVAVHTDGSYTVEPSCPRRDLHVILDDLIRVLEQPTA